MQTYTLYYWPLPFRGHFVRAVLAHIGADWHEADIEDVADLRLAAPERQLVPHMGPPVLTDHKAGMSLSQMPAILTYLGECHDLVPDDPAARALTAKVLGDTNDILYEMTRFNGAQMWTQPAWDAYAPRLARWMRVFEELGARHGLAPRSGYVLGTTAPGIADFATQSLWGVMTAQLPELRHVLEKNAPAVAGLSDRIGNMPEQATLWTRSRDAYDTLWCGGDIEASLRSVL